MNSKRDTAVKAAFLKIEKLAHGIDVIGELPDLCNINRMHISGGDGAVFINAPYDLETYRHNRKVLSAAGWKATMAFVVSDGDRFTHLKKGNDSWITYIMQAGIQGSTCARVKVGEEVTDVYQVSCKED